MFVFVLISFFVGIGICVESDLSDESDYNFRVQKSARSKGKEMNFSQSFFSWLENYQVDADPVTENEYPWIARVVHSRTKNIPHVCTASCIDPAIFITAARCIYSLRVNYTSIIYKSKHLQAIAFVLPSDMSKQAFDDIGFIIVRSTNVKGAWSTVKLFNNVKRTDNVFTWFVSFSNGNIKSKVIGYAAQKGPHKRWKPETQYNLTALDINVGLDICPTLLTDQVVLQAFIVPCYYSCSVAQLLRNKETCKKYHGVEGGAIIDTVSKKLMGVATWGTYNNRVSIELPVGFAFPNSDNFNKDFICAKLIRDANEMLNSKGYYQSLCNP